MENDVEFYSFSKVVIFGLKGVGKETLINMMKKDVFENKAYSDDCIYELLIRYHFYYYSYQFKKNFCRFRKITIFIFKNI